MNARDRILGRLRSVAVDLPTVGEPATLTPLGASADECVRRFCDEAGALGVSCFVEATADAVARRLEQVVNGLRVLSWDAEHLPYDAARVLTNATFGSDSRAHQAAAEIGVTGCDAAIAETGSLVLFSGPGRSRAVSLLPPVHVAIVERRKLCFTMAEMFALHAERLTQAASCTIITGPSRTADIELTLTLGIHGPGRVVVVLGP
jgi:L-lactate dehydrogenase complex protein LldG